MAMERFVSSFGTGINFKNARTFRCRGGQIRSFRGAQGNVIGIVALQRRKEGCFVFSGRKMIVAVVALVVQQRQTTHDVVEPSTRD